MARAQISPVIPHVRQNGTVVCMRCGGQMDEELFTRFPGNQRFHYWRCILNPDHITASLPLKRRWFHVYR